MKLRITKRIGVPDTYRLESWSPISEAWKPRSSVTYSSLHLAKARVVELEAEELDRTAIWEVVE